LIIAANLLGKADSASRSFLDGTDLRPLRGCGFLHRKHSQPEHPRAAYAVAVRAFFTWLDSKQVAQLTAVRTRRVLAHVELLAPLSRGDRQSAPPRNPHAVRAVDRRSDFRWSQCGAAVRGPKPVVKKGKTPVPDGDEAKSCPIQSTF
jgi:hypothetical protein